MGKLDRCTRNRLVCLLLHATLATDLVAQAHSAPVAPPAGARTRVCKNRPVPQLIDVTAKSGITFNHLAAPEKKYIVESMSGGVLLVDYDRDGWPDIYFTNAPTVEMALKGEKAKGALYHNNHDGTFTDVTEKAGIATPCFAMGGAVGDYNNDGWPDLYVTCLGRQRSLSQQRRRHLYRRDQAGRRSRRPLVDRARPSPTTTATASST